MQLSVVSVGVRLPTWINQGVAEYQKRLPAELKVELKEVLPVKRSKTQSVAKVQKLEAERIESAIPAGSLMIVLDERGKSKSTQMLSEELKSWMQEGQSVCFIIGGADGINDDIKGRARQSWSLSAMTLPHGLARVLLMEQLYRAWSILNNHPYHRG